MLTFLEMMTSHKKNFGGGHAVQHVQHVSSPNRHQTHTPSTEVQSSTNRTAREAPPVI